MISQHIYPEEFTTTDLTGIFLISVSQEVLVHIAPTGKYLKKEESVDVLCFSHQM